MDKEYGYIELRKRLVIRLIETVIWMLWDDEWKGKESLKAALTQVSIADKKTS